MNKRITATALLLLALTGCSSGSDKGTSTSGNTTTTTTAPSLDFSQAVTTTTTDTSSANLDVVSSATVLTEDMEYGDTTFEIMYKNASVDTLLLEKYMGADSIVYFALATDFKIDATTPLEVIHQSLKESLGDRYETVRDSFDLITLQQFVANASEMESKRQQYGLDFSDLPSAWFDGATAQEKKLIEENILSYCNINDLLNYHHYSAVDGIDVFLKFYLEISTLEEYMLTQDDTKQAKVAALLPSILDDPSKVQASDYTTQLTYNLTVRELIDLRTEFLEHFSDELYGDFENLVPKRIGFYNDNTSYGLSAIEYIQSGKDQTDDVTTYANQVVSHWDGEYSSKTAQLYLPKLADEGSYFVVTLQEIKVDDKNAYTFLKVETSSSLWYASDMAIELHRINEEKVKILDSVNSSTPAATETTEKPEETEDAKETTSDSDKEEEEASDKEEEKTSDSEKADEEETSDSEQKEVPDAVEVKEPVST